MFENISHFFLNYVVCKVNSVHEACVKCFEVHILKLEILQITWKKWNEKHQFLSFQFLTNRFSILVFLLQYFKVWCVNCKAYGASFFYYVDFNMKIKWDYFSKFLGLFRIFELHHKNIMFFLQISTSEFFALCCIVFLYLSIHL